MSNKTILPLYINNKSQFMLAHFACCLLGFVGCVSSFLYKVGRKLAEHANLSMPYTFWAKMTLAVKKPAFMAAYLGGMSAICIYLLCLCVYIYLQQQKPAIPFKKPVEIGVLKLSLSVVLLANIILFWAFMTFISLPIWFVLTTLWLGIFLGPFYDVIVVWVGAINLPFKERSVSFAILSLAILLFIAALSPYLYLNHLKVSNDFLWVPETTVIDGKFIDNNRYIMQQGIGGLFSDQLIRSKQDINLSHYNSISLASQPNLSTLKSTLKVIADDTKNTISIQSDIQSHYAYNDVLKVLFEKTGDDASQADYMALCSLVSSADCRAIQSFIPKIHAPYSQEAMTFIKNNTYELSNEIIVGHYFYHQYAMLGPLNELLLGKPASSILFLYGWGNTYLLAAMTKWVNPDLNFAQYTTGFYSLYLLYYLLLVVCSVVIFKQLRYITFVTVGSIGLFFLMGFELIRLAPGFNPLRHFLDLPLILLLYGYFQSKRFPSFYLLGACATASLAVIANQQFGLMMFVSLIGAVTLHIVISTHKYRDFIWPVLASVITFAALYVIHGVSGSNTMGLYTILGVSVSPVYTATLIVLFGFTLSLYAALFFIASQRGVHHRPLYLLLFLFFYTQCLLLYYVWYTEIGHLAVTSPIWLLCLVLFYKEIMELFSNYPKAKKALNGGLLCLATLLLIFAGGKYFYQQMRYNAIFTTHKVYQWDFKRARFLSTMDPVVFQEAIDLIHQYSSSNSIYIVSKYDILLPYLAGKYSAMPYLELITSLVTTDEIAKASSAILEEKPKYIFVDTDIKDSHMGDMVDSTDPVMSRLDRDGLSFGRAMVLREMRQVFYKIAPEYKLIKQGFLISVYEHK